LRIWGSFLEPDGNTLGTQKKTKNALLPHPPPKNPKEEN